MNKNIEKVTISKREDRYGCEYHVVRYYSVYTRQWETTPVTRISDQELETMDYQERQRVLRARERDGQIGEDGTAARAAAATLGSIGGRVKSERKAAAVRENGKKGGRPRKE